jgi:hypothetical protein
MATVIDFDDLNPGAKFTFKEEKSDKKSKKEGKIISWVKVRAYTNEALEDIRRECVKQEVEYKKAAKFGTLQRIEYTQTDDQRMKRLLWDYVIVEWGGFSDKQGKEILCTTENKEKFMLQWPEFAAFVDKCLEKLTPDVNEAIKESEKN